MKSKNNLIELHKNFIEGTNRKQHVPLFLILIGTIPIKVKNAIMSRFTKIYISTRVLKHIYDRYHHDKGQIQVYMTIISNLKKMVCDPDLIKKNKKGSKKRGEVVFIKNMYEEKYAFPVEIEKSRKHKKSLERLCIASAFKLKNDGKYLEKEDVLYQK